LEREGILLSAKGLLGFVINYEKASCQNSAPNLNSDFFLISFKPQELCVFVYLFVYARESAL